MKRIIILFMCLCMVSVGNAQFLINQTGYVGPRNNSGSSRSGNIVQGFVQGLTQGTTQQRYQTNSNSSLGINQTGVVGDANFGQYYDLGNGAYFKGIVKNDRRYAGTMHYTDGSEEIGFWDEYDQLHGLILITWPNGTWWYGNVSHGKQDGKGSSYSNGRYYNQTWTNGTLLSSEEVSEPWYNKANLDQSIRNMYANKDYSSGSSSNSSSSSTTRSLRTCSKCLGKGICSVCNGTGYYKPGLLGNPVKCRCNNGKCTLCNGTGKYGH